MIAREELEMLRDTCHTILDAMKFLWMDRDGGFKGLELRHVGHYVEMLGQIAAIYEPVLPKYEVVFGLFARVSRQPYWSIAFTATSTTEYVLKHGIHMAQAIDGSLRDRTIRKKQGLTEEEREMYRNFWKVLREPFCNSSMLPTYAKCLEHDAEVDWEYHRVLDKLPPEGKRTMPEPGTIEVFFSYSHKDEKLREQLVNHLSQLKHEGLIRDWHDRKIGAGTEWDGVINEHLRAADIVLLLVSSDFLASRYIHDVEVKSAMERHEAGDARVIPVVLRACDWQSAPFGKLQGVPKDGKPITSWSNKDEAFTDVAKGIRAAVKELLAAKPASGSA